MDREQEKHRIETALAEYQELAKHFSDGATNEVVVELIAELKQRLRELEE